MDKYFGVIPSPPSPLDYNVSRIAVPAPLPPSVRLDEKILSIRNQWVFPTCVGKAGAGIMSAYLEEELSSIYIYSKCKEIDGIPDVPGTYLKTACQVMLHKGSCTAKLLPYSDMTDPVPKMKAVHDAEATSRKINMYAKAVSLRDIKQALTNGYMLMGCMLLGDNFMYYSGDNVIGKPTGNIYGYHAIIVCGYDDTKQALRIANSWGTKGWGDNGFGWVSYDVLNSLLHWPEAWVLDVVKKKEEPLKPKTAEEIYPDRIFRELRRYLKKNS